MEALETAFAEGAGRALAQVVDGPLLQFSEAFECAHCARPFEEPQTRLFSFNNPFGACPTCHGFGNLIEVDQELVVPDVVQDPGRRRHRALEQAPLPRAVTPSCSASPAAAASRWTCPGRELSEDHRRCILEGDEEFQGVVGFFRWLETKKYKVQVRVFLSRYRGYRSCPDCRGRRLRREALQVKVGGLDIGRGLRAVAARGAEFLGRWRSTSGRRASPRPSAPSWSGGCASWPTSASTT